jgi:hypothetical protein
MGDQRNRARTKAGYSVWWLHAGAGGIETTDRGSLALSGRSVPHWSLGYAPAKMLGQEQRP